MANTSSQPLSLKFGGKLVTGRLVTNVNGDAEWYKGSDQFPTLKSNKSDNYTWNFVEAKSITNLRNLINTGTGTTVFATDNDLTKDFYGSNATSKKLNDARINTFKSTAGLNNLAAAKAAAVPGSGVTLPPQPEPLKLPDQSFADALSKGAISSKSRPKYENLQYPEKLSIQKQDTLKISVLEYKPKKDFSGLTFSERPTENRTILGSVILPVTSGISDSNKVNWGENSLNAFQATLANIALETVGGGAKAGVDATKQAIDKIAQNLPDAQKGLANYFAGKAVGVSGLLARTEGAVINPNMETLFNAPSLRPFSFTYRLSPRSQKESKTILKIIRMFKQSMAAQRNDNGLFLKAPNTYKLQFRNAKDEHKFLPKIKECALLSFDVNYTPENSYATFTDGSMVSYELTFQFQELDPIFNDDYTNLDNDKDLSIGY